VPVALTSDEILFSEIYHSLIHSQSLETLLSLDDTYCAEVQKLLSERDKNIANIEKRSEHIVLADVYMLLRGYHTAVFISARISSLSVDNGLKHGQGQLSTDGLI